MDYQNRAQPNRLTRETPVSLSCAHAQSIKKMANTVTFQKRICSLLVLAMSSFTKTNFRLYVDDIEYV